MYYQQKLRYNYASKHNARLLSSALAIGLDAYDMTEQG